jgi:hypothetical protein
MNKDGEGRIASAVRRWREEERVTQPAEYCNITQINLRTQNCPHENSQAWNKRHFSCRVQDIGKKNFRRHKIFQKVCKCFVCVLISFLKYFWQEPWDTVSVSTAQRSTYFRLKTEKKLSVEMPHDLLWTKAERNVLWRWLSTCAGLKVEAGVWQQLSLSRTQAFWDRKLSVGVRF